MSDEKVEKKEDEQPAVDNPEDTDAEIVAESEAAEKIEEKGEEETELSDSDSTKSTVDSEPSESAEAAEVPETSGTEQPAAEVSETSEGTADAEESIEEHTDEGDSAEGPPQSETPSSGPERPADVERGPAIRRSGPYRGPGSQRPGSYGRGGERRMDGDGDRSRGPRYKVYFRKKVCKFCSKKIGIHFLDHETLRRFTTDRGKMLPARITGNCAKHQRQLAKAIKRARSLALLPFVTR